MHLARDSLAPASTPSKTQVAMSVIPSACSLPSCVFSTRLLVDSNWHTSDAASLAPYLESRSLPCVPTLPGLPGPTERHLTLAPSFDVAFEKVPEGFDIPFGPILL